jgi:hypothetical protein
MCITVIGWEVRLMGTRNIFKFMLLEDLLAFLNNITPMVLFGKIIPVFNFYSMDKMF